ncbi:MULTISPECIES: hypothetical protein [unclassified Streptomyces]|uniref:hypothetical protein n=1 Tax=unclassified Streptomyces TaxID=2593676 RepID=UPI0034361EC9
MSRFKPTTYLCAGEMKTALILLRTFVEELRDQGLLMTDYRGEPLGDVLQRYVDSFTAAEVLAGVLGKVLQGDDEGPRYAESSSTAVQLAGCWARRTPLSGISRTGRRQPNESRHLRPWPDRSTGVAIVCLRTS